MSAKIGLKQGINFGASWVEVRVHIGPFTHFSMPFSLTNG